MTLIEHPDRAGNLTPWSQQQINVTRGDNVLMCSSEYRWAQNATGLTWDDCVLGYIMWKHDIDALLCVMLMLSK